jgi:hypothetical protein
VPAARSCRPPRRPARDLLPLFSTTDDNLASGCRWLIGNDVPGLTANDFGKTAQYGKLLPLQYLMFGGGGAITTRFNDFQNNLGLNPCKA